MKKFVLKVVWLPKTIAIAIDQEVGKTTTPLTEFIFWPEKDAWEELQSQLSVASWVSSKQATALLNQTSELIAYWQENNHDEVSHIELNEKFDLCSFLFIKL